VIGFVS
jgi:HEAT repeat